MAEVFYHEKTLGNCLRGADCHSLEEAFQAFMKLVRLHSQNLRSFELPVKSTQTEAEWGISEERPRWVLGSRKVAVSPRRRELTGVVLQKIFTGAQLVLKNDQDYDYDHNRITFSISLSDALQCWEKAIEVENSVFKFSHGDLVSEMHSL